MHRCGQRTERLFAVEHDLHDLDGREQSVAGGGVLAENDVAGLLAADQVAVCAHILCHVLVTDRCLFITDADGVERLVQAEVGHHGRDDFGAVQASLLQHVPRADVEDLVPVHDGAVFVHGKAAVCVAVKGKAHVQPMQADKFLEVFDVRGANAVVDIRAIRLVADDIGIRAQRVKDVFRHHPCTAVGAVEPDLHTLVRMRGQRDQITDVAVAAGGIILRAADLRARGERNLKLAVEIPLDLLDDVLLHLLARAVEQLDAVVVIGVVARADHDAAVKIVRPDDVGDAGCRGDMHQICIRARRGQARGQGVFIHVARTPGVLADDDGAFMLTPVIPAEKAPDAVRVLDRQVNVGFPAKAVSAKILGHVLPPIVLSAGGG